MSVSSSQQINPEALFQTIKNASPQEVVKWSHLIRKCMQFYKYNQCTNIGEDWRQRKLTLGKKQDYEIAFQIYHLSSDGNLKNQLKETFLEKVKMVSQSVSSSEKTLLNEALGDLSFQKPHPQTSGHKELAAPQGIVSYAYACRGAADLDLFNRISALTAEEIIQLNATEIAKLARAYACLKRNLEDSGTKMTTIDFFEKLHQHAMTLDDFTGKDIVRFTWAHAYASSYTTWDQKDWKRADAMMKEHCEKLATPLTASMNELDARDVLKICWSFFKVYGVADKAPQLADQLANCILQKVKLSINTLSPKEIADLISILIESGIKDPQVLGQLKTMTEQNLGQFSPEQVVTLTGSFMIEHLKNPVLWISSLLKKINEFQKRMENGEIDKKWSHEELAEINLAVKLYNLRCSDYKMSKFLLEESLSTQIDKCNSDINNHPPKPSKIHEEIVRFLKTAVFHYELFDYHKFDEQVPFASFFFNIVFKGKNAKLAVLIDEPMHYERNSDKYKKGEILKKKYVDFIGYHLIRIPYSVEDKSPFLKKALFSFSRCQRKRLQFE